MTPPPAASVAAPTNDERLWSRRNRSAVLWAGVLLVLAVLAAYHNSFTGPFIFDDRPSIVENPTIRQLWPVTAALSPPQGEGLTVSGRPVLNFSFAVNYALGGDAVWSYHALNLLIHLLAGLTLFGIVRRTLVLVGRVVPNPPAAVSIGSDRRVKDPAFAQRYGGHGNAFYLVSLAVAALWMVHPLQTESVTYVVQRAESLMGLFYLLTLYCFVRGAECHLLNDKPGGWKAAAWQACSVVFCLLGMATKEVMVTAPLMVCLYDRTFVSGGFTAAWRRHGRLYLGLAATWLLLGYLVISTEGRGQTAGFGTEVPWWAYALTQCRAVVHYLRLAAWPHPLSLDYGTMVVRDVALVAPQALLLALLAAGTVIALWRRPVLGFLGTWFFGILAPSSSIVPVATQTMAEHRMYLPLAALIVLAVLGMHRLVGSRSLLLFLGLAAGFGWLTAQRNHDYRSEIAIWSEPAAQPGSSRARCSLGIALVDAGRLTEAAAQFAEALRLDSQNAEAHAGLGGILAQRGNLAEAVAENEAALRIDPGLAVAHNNLGNALLGLGRAAEAVVECTKAVQLNPRDARAHYNLGYALLQSGRTTEAIGGFQEALRLKLDSADLHYNLGNALIQAGRIAEAIPQYEAAVQRAPDLAPAHGNLANALLQVGRPAEAVAQYEQALRLTPADADMHFNLGVALHKLGRPAEARREFETVLRLRPDDAEARGALQGLSAEVPATEAGR
jgi:tetratricopeptide (TPR) repeat protein